MKKVDTIGRVAENLNIAPSTLRYWDKEGLINFERNEENNYREINFKTIMDICDIVLFREISIPIKEIKEYQNYDLVNMEKGLQKGKENILKQIEELEKIVKKIEYREKMISKLDYLKEKNFEIKENNFDSIYSFDFDNQEYARIYIEDPYKIFALKKGDNFQYGILDTNGADDKLIRKTDKGNKQFVKGLFKVNSENTKDTNIDEFVEYANSLGYKHGFLIGNYIISVMEDKKYDYYEGWLEIF